MTEITVTVRAPVNIAVIKYWGKRDNKLILPINSSLSATIDQNSMRSQTTVTASSDLKEDQMAINQKTVSLKTDKRLQTVLQLIRARANDIKADGKTVITAEELKKLHVKIVSDNNFPTAAGLASSASGLAAFTFALAQLYNFQENYPGELTTIARQGSGSACRSMFGGWVKWEKGAASDGKDSIAIQVAPASAWPDMRILILVIGKGQKETSSTHGMDLTVKTSPLIQHRMNEVVPDRMKKMEQAILAKDFKTFGELTMQDSNQFHAVCLDTYPPLFYLNEGSHRVISLVHQFNNFHNGVVAAYTFDAGPNAVIYTLKSHFDLLLGLFLHYLTPKENDGKFCQDPLGLADKSQSFLSSLDKLTSKIGPKKPRDDTAVSSIILTKVGEGPTLINKTVKGSKLRSKL